MARRYFRAVVLAWKLWDIRKYGDDPYDNVTLRTAWAVAYRLWVVS